MIDNTNINLDKKEFTHRLALAALLHDLGKIGQRAYLGKNYLQVPEKEYSEFLPSPNTYLHVAYTYELLKNCNAFIENKILYSIINPACYHHNPSQNSIEEQIITYADRLASSHDRYKTEKDKDPESDVSFRDARLYNILNVLRLPKGKYTTKIAEDNTQIHKIPIAKGIGKELLATKEISYEDLWKSLKDYINIFTPQDTIYQSIEKALMLLEWYGWSVPASNFQVLPDTSLAEHSKAVAIIAAAIGSLYMSFDNDSQESFKQDLSLTQNSIEEWRNIEQLENITPMPLESKLPNGACFQLVIGDLTGIQSFLYDINTKNAARNLKGRSFAVEMWTDRIAANILDAFDMPGTCRVYATGGKFLLILPNLPAKDNTGVSETSILLEELAKKINDDIKQEYPNCSVRFKYAAIPLKQGHLYSKFLGQLLDELFEELAKVSRKPELTSDDLDKLFEPQEPSSFEIKAMEVDEVDTRFINFGKNLSKKNGLAVYSEKQEAEDILKVPGFNEWIKVINVSPQARENSKSVLAFNNFQDCSDGFRWYSGIECAEWPSLKEIQKSTFWRKLHEAAKESAAPDDTSMDHEALIQFEHFGLAAKQMTGFNRIGILRMDVDNLGLMFSQGLQEYEKFVKQYANEKFKEQFRESSIYTLSRIMAVSNMLIRFFGGALPHILDTPIDPQYLEAPEDKLTYKDLVNVIYAGGDDAFLVGPWNLMPDLALLIEESFRKWHGENPELTISAGIAVTDGKYPISVAAKDAGEAEEQAKGFKLPGETDSELCKYPQIKSSLNFLEASARWQQWATVKELKNQMIKTTQNIEGEKTLITISSRVFSLFKKGEEFVKKTTKSKKEYDEVIKAYGYPAKWKAYLNYAVSKSKKQNSIEEFTNNLIEPEKVKEYSTKLLGQNPIEFLGVITRWCGLTIRKGIK